MLQELKKYSVPRSPTKNGPHHRITPALDPAGFTKLYRYCLQDVRAEANLSEVVPDLSEFEERVWITDQIINERGVQVDAEAIRDCTVVVALTRAKHSARLIEITGDSTISIDKVAQLKKWVETQGIVMGSFDKECVQATIDRLRPEFALVREVLETRQALGSSSVRKLATLLRTICADGRVRGLFAYHAAATGRWGGRMAQPQNLPRGGPAIKRVDEALEDFRKAAVDQDVAPLEEKWGDVLSTVGSVLRGLFVSRPGTRLISSDYSAIEAVVLAELAEEPWRQGVFRTHGKIYEATAADIAGVPLSEVTPELRQTGKTAELACFGADTQVLTDSGWKPIVAVQVSDLLHDGVGFVSHSGVVSRGNRLTTVLKGVTVTPDHKFFIGGNRWETTEGLNASTRCLNQAIDTATSLLRKSLGSPERVGCCSLDADVLAGRKVGLIGITYLGEAPHGVTNALKLKLAFLARGMTGVARTESIEGGYLTVFPQRSIDAVTRATRAILTTAHGASRFVRNGLRIKMPSFYLSELCTAGTNRGSQSTVSTTTKGTIRATSDSFCTKGNKVTNSKQSGLTFGADGYPVLNFIESTLRTLLNPVPFLGSYVKGLPRKKYSDNQRTEVFDIINCGPRNRFVIRTAVGPLIAHNSGYQGGINAWKRFGADEFMTDAQILRAIQIWRAKSPNIVAFWGGLEKAAKLATEHSGMPFGYKRITYEKRNNDLYCRLPSGRELVYHSVRLEPGNYGLQIAYMGWNTDRTKGPYGWTKRHTYGGAFCENICQGVARDVLANALVNLESCGYPVVLHVHDEVVSEVPLGTGTVVQFEGIMNVMPAWAQGWPIKAKGGWEGHRYRKG